MTFLQLDKVEDSFAPCPRQHARRRRSRRPADVFRPNVRPRHISPSQVFLQSAADAAAAHVAAVPAARLWNVYDATIRGTERTNNSYSGTTGWLVSWDISTRPCSTSWRTAAGRDACRNACSTGYTRPGTGQAVATCRAAPSATIAAAVLRRPRWPQDCAGEWRP